MTKGNRYDAGDCSGGGGSTWQRLQHDYPWLLFILESHREKCQPENWTQIGCFQLCGSDIHCTKCSQVVSDWEKDRKCNRPLGIIGFGNFGRFAAAHLARAFCDVMVTDIKQPESPQTGFCWGSLAEAVDREIIVLAVPFQNLEELLKQISSALRPGALIVDVCSVKQEPVNLMLQYLPSGVEILATHPLFGPQSAKDGLNGHKIVLCPVRISEKRVNIVHNLLRRGFRLHPIVKEPAEHDREMARVQGLTHFIARAMSELGVGDSELATKAYEHLMEATRLLGSDSWELFETIENGNPFAAGMRQKLMAKLEELEERLNRG